MKFSINIGGVELSEAEPKPELRVPSPEEAQAALDALVSGAVPPPQEQPGAWKTAALFSPLLFVVGAMFMTQDSTWALGLGICMIGPIVPWMAFNMWRDERAIRQALAAGLPRPVKQQRPLGAPVMGVLAVFLGVMAMQYAKSGENLSALLIGAFALVMALGAVASFIQGRKARRVAAVMSEAAAQTPQAIESTAEAPLWRGAPPRVKFIASRALEATGLLPPPAPGRSVLGAPPQKILYLYNFHSSDTLTAKLQGGWQRHGPVWFLGSPMDLAATGNWFADAGKSAEASLIVSPADFDARFAAREEGLLPPGDQRLKASLQLTGGWAQEMFLCADASWKHGVDVLLSAADVVIIDAADYEPARGGLNWEIERVLNKMPLDKVLVVTKDTADLNALERMFVTAWQSLGVDSPNARHDPAPVRIVVYPGNVELRTAERRLLCTGPTPDPAGVGAQMNTMSRVIVEGSYDEACEADRAMALLVAPAGPRSA